MTDNISALARDEVRLRQIQSMRQMGRLDPRSADAQALLFTSVRDGFSRSASALLTMGVPPGYVGWTQLQADRYLAGELDLASQMVVSDRMAARRLSTRTALSRHPMRTVHWA